ncbi:acyltransferase family protein [Oerskovia sp. KBS0722]|uniref:acyltransferase family protein n=1 Tax=Oerskovia sp. KBS0722 TaxID=1179673 RepID=UPI00110DB62E|nr:acyltransferase family protein [Oerskovia sp. KBS0722]QDW64173.1 acyltransferase [Oerskovia sp. KBS0722]
MTLPTPISVVHPGPGTSRVVTTPATGLATSGRRDDLDGLRAVAILLVAIYHVWVHRVSGGVDVFLLLSGFFVGGGLLRSFARGRPVRLGTYLPRLGRRLLPALVVTLLGVAVATLLVLPATRWADLSRESLASLLYVENWHLATSGQVYGAADVDQSPLQHIWSLSVQGQLFVLVPLALVAVWWLGRRLEHRTRLRLVSICVAAAAATSFVYAAVLVGVDQPFAYYDTFARAWEYLAGTILALVVVRTAWSRTRRLVAGWLGVALVLATGMLVDGGSAFPGPWTLVPLAGAALVVLAGAGGAPVGVSRLLAWRPLAKAGGYAYSFYLWHWPVLVFMIAVRDRPVGWLAGTAVLVLSAGLAWATKCWVEDPVRRRSTVEPVLSSAVSARAKHVRAVGRSRLDKPLAALVAVGLLLPTAWLGHVEVVKAQSRSISSLADLEKYPGAFAVLDPGVFLIDDTIDPIPSTVAAIEDKVRAVADGCGTGVGAADVKVCSYGSLDADRVIAVVGGSHAEFWIDALAEVGEREGFRVDTIIKWGCSLIDGTDGTGVLSEDPSCIEWSDGALDRLRLLRPDAVFTTATRPAPEEIPGREMVPGAYVSAWDRLSADGISVVAIRDTPWLPVSPVDCIEVQGPYAPACAIERTEVLDDVDPLVELDSRTPGNVRFVDLNDVLCPDDTCPFVQGNRIVYRDSHHLTATYAQTLAPVLGHRVLEVLEW